MLDSIPPASAPTPTTDLSLLAPVQAAQATTAMTQIQHTADDGIAEEPAEVEPATCSERTEDGTPAQPAKKVRPPVQGPVSAFQTGR